ncbi:SYCN protein, partial [Columbina picui]|nr:SYCN protein [Columbina picui]
CPSPASLRPPDGPRVCAQLYADSSAYDERCCAGAALLVAPGADVPFMPGGWGDRASSLVVGPRCELTVWALPGKRGKSRKFSA